jgi:hypothetical protein
VTLTFADTGEAAVASAAVESDPIKALLRAQRDDLLRYHGFVAGDRYEIEVAGREWDIPAAEVGDLVQRLRAIASLSAAGADARLKHVGQAGTFTVEVAGRVVELPGELVVDWCEGYVAAASAVGQEHAGDDNTGELGELFDNPSLDDQCRMVVLGLMHRADGDRMSMTKLAQMIGALPDVPKPPAKKTVVDALGFGAYLGSELAERMIRAFGLRWAVSAGAAPCATVEGEAAEALPEMPGLARLRRLVHATRAGWLRYVGVASPNQARWSRRYAVTVGQQGYVIDAGRLDAWLDGVEAFHTGRG